MNINAKHSNLLRAGEGYNKDYTFKKAKTHITEEDERRMHEQTCSVQHTGQLNICTFPILQEHQH
jgi:hypothetical protein